MESESFEEYKNLVNEIAKGMDQVKQLIAASSSGNQERALEKRLTSYEEALSILHGMNPQKRSGLFQRRRSVETITTRVRADSDVPPDDGYNWRKYGQKEILGSIYPRSYYRCSQRYDRGCQAKKQVHRFGGDPSVMEIVYRFTHTCVGPANKPPPPENQLEHPEVEDLEDESSFTVGR